MRRDEFLKALGAFGACSCAGVWVNAAAQADDAKGPSPEVEGLKSKIDFMRKRFAKLVSILGDNLDEPTRKKVFESLGRECARLFMDLTGKFKGDPRGFLEEIRKRWAKSAEYDEASGTIRVVDKSDRCTCAFVDESLTPSTFCDCTLGWQKETYAMILGQPVDAELEESVLRGGQRCVFRIRVVKNRA